MGPLRGTFGTRLLGSYLRIVFAFLLAGLLAVVTLAAVDSLDGASAVVALLAVGVVPVLAGMALLAVR